MIKKCNFWKYCFIATFFLLTFPLAYLLSLSGLDIDRYLWIYFITITIVLSWYAKRFHMCFLIKDQTEFLAQFEDEVYVTHKAREEVMMQKIKLGKIVPFFSKQNNCVNTFFRKRGWIDHHKKVTWVSPGVQSLTSKGASRGNHHKYNMGVIFKVAKNELKFPSGLFQAFLGSKHMVIESEVTFTKGDTLHIFEDGNWREFYSFI